MSIAQCFSYAACFTFRLYLQGHFPVKAWETCSLAFMLSPNLKHAGYQTSLICDSLRSASGNWVLWKLDELYVLTCKNFISYTVSLWTSLSLTLRGHMPSKLKAEWDRKFHPFTKVKIVAEDAQCCLIHNLVLTTRKYLDIDFQHTVLHWKKHLEHELFSFWTTHRCKSLFEQLID